MRELDWEGAPLWQCQACEGLWLSDSVLEALLDASQARLQRSSLQGSLVAQDRGLDLEAELVCPVCSTAMRRSQYIGQSKVVVDACAQHGIWLDDGELGQLILDLKDFEDRSEAVLGQAALPTISPEFWRSLRDWFRNLGRR